MGSDKALLEAGGSTLLERAIRVLRLVSDDVFIVGRRVGYGAFGVPAIPDRFSNAGVLGGIATALRHARHTRTVIVGCDMPLLSARLLRAIADADPDADAIVPIREQAHTRQGGQHTFETLHAVYHRRCIRPIERRLAIGDLRVFGFFEDVTVRYLDEAWLREIEPTLMSMVNANTPAEFQRALEMLESERTAQEDHGG